MVRGLVLGFTWARGSGNIGLELGLEATGNIGLEFGFEASGNPVSEV